jgi:cytochrome c biogenesis protein CcmG/thiol:disulfide interchange protein DsbE
MKNRILLLVGGLGMGLLLGGLILWIIRAQPENPQFSMNPLPRIGSAIPAFELSDLEGKKKSNLDFQGRPVIINFWATWCGPCKLEMPILQKIRQEYDGKISLVAVNFEEPRETVKQFLTQNKIEVPVLLDETGSMANSYGIHAFPVTYFIDAKGVIKSMHIGQLDKEMVKTYIKTMGIEE